MPAMNPHGIRKGMRLVNEFIEEHWQTFLNPFGDGRIMIGLCE
jgi:hypothetical protein